MLTYEFNVLLHGKESRPAANCPVDLRNSGLYDEEVPVCKPCLVSVTATSKDEAGRKVLEHAFGDSDSVELISTAGTYDNSDDDEGVVIMQEGHWLDGDGTHINAKNFAEILKKAS